MNFSPANGEDMALIIARPPAASAGKNFTTSSPNSTATWISVGVAQPGMTGILRPLQ